jgi:LPXTG-motif cell wall-anchored protein
MKKLLFLLAVMLIAVGISVAQTDQNNPNSNPANSPTATPISPSAQGSATTPDQGTANQSATDQTSTTTTTTRHHKGAKSGNLPQTASPLPVLGLLGMGSLAAGVATRKKKRS